jgi:nucleoside-diphosphate-sugar epimerase
MVYGPGDRQHRFFPYLKRMVDRRPMIVMGHEADWRSTWGYVENVAEAVVLAIEHDEAAGRTYNVADEPAYTMRDWVDRIGAATGWTGQIVSVPGESFISGSYNWQQDVCTDTTRIRTELDFTEPVSVDVALDRTIAWERQHPPEIDPAQFDYAAEDRLAAGESA